MKKKPKLSIVVPCRRKEDAKEFVESLKHQSFKDFEVILSTEGSSESAKSNGIRRASGSIIGLFASDNHIVGPNYLKTGVQLAEHYGASSGLKYHYDFGDNALNRYFSLIGGNDPLSFALGKNDKEPWAVCLRSKRNCFRTHGDNGFFVRKDRILKSNLESYFHIDNIFDIRESIVIKQYEDGLVWHKTGGSLLTYLKKRMRYGLQHSYSDGRRYHLVGLGDLGLLWSFVGCSLLVLPNVITAYRGFREIRDPAWFLHPIVSLMIVLMYAALLPQLLLSALWGGLSRLILSLKTSQTRRLRTLIQFLSLTKETSPSLDKKGLNSLRERFQSSLMMMSGSPRNTSRMSYESWRIKKLSELAVPPLSKESIAEIEMSSNTRASTDSLTTQFIREYL